MSHVLDFSQLDPTNVKQMLRFNWLINGFTQTRQAQLDTITHAQLCAFMASGRADWEDAAAKLQDAWKKVSNSLIPWLHTSQNSVSLEAAYIHKYGKPGTPEHDAKVAETIAQLSKPADERIFESFQQSRQER